MESGASGYSCPWHFANLSNSEFHMPVLSRKLTTTVAFALTLGVLTPTLSLAREGAQSVGKGIKCYTTGTYDANGNVKYIQVCYKSI